MLLFVWAYFLFPSFKIVIIIIIIIIFTSFSILLGFLLSLAEEKGGAN